MHNQNPVQAAIKQVMKPILDNRRMSAEGTIQALNYQDNTARIYWKDPLSSAPRENANVPLPVDGDGIFRQALEEGDTVTLDFKHGDINFPYISSVHKKFRGVNYQSKYGAGIPKGMGML